MTCLSKSIIIKHILTVELTS